MTRLTFLFFSLGWSVLALAQIDIRPLPGSSPQARQDQDDDPLPAIFLPFWDDFSTSESQVGELWEYSEGVQVSYGFAENPPSLKAATLDGVDGDGLIYDDEDVFPGMTDQLISRRIDLSGLLNDESVYLSFYWEAGGNVEKPEDPGDSLSLQFLNADSVWISIWNKQSLEVDTFEIFQQEILQVERDFRHENFRFKFESYGNQFGPFDTWHIDYVYLNNGRTINDLNYFDRTMSGVLSSLTDPYREMPAEHFYKDPQAYLVNQELVITNLQNTLHTAILDYHLENTVSGQTYDFTDASNTLNPGEVRPVTLNNVASISALDPPPDSVVFDVRVSSNFNDPTSPVDFGVNDTIRDRYIFRDYYAYDDGSAEFAAGVGQNGSVAVEFVLTEPDTLTHIDIYFPTITPTPAGKTLLVNVWKSLEDEEPAESRSITVVDSLLNSFTRVRLTRPVVVTDTVYIGYQQRTSEFLAIGLDRSNQEAKEKMFYLAQGSWNRNRRANGIMMIRPVFQSLDNLPVGVKEPLVSGFFPNPVNQTLHIENDYDEISILTIDGRLLLREPRQASHDLSELKKGLFILQINRNGTLQSHKLLKE